MLEFGASQRGFLATHAVSQSSRTVAFLPRSSVSVTAASRFFKGLEPAPGKFGMGLLSFFRSSDPSKNADDLVASALSLFLSGEEKRWIALVGVEPDRYISERNVLRMGMTLAGVALALGLGRHIGSPAYKFELALEKRYGAYFSSVLNDDPEQGRNFYERAQRRYILRDPVEMAGVFHYYLVHPNAWGDLEAERTPHHELPKGFQEFVRKVMAAPLEEAIEIAKKMAA